MAEAQWILRLGPGDEHRVALVDLMAGRQALVRFMSNRAELIVPRDMLRPVPKPNARPPAELLD